MWKWEPCGGRGPQVENHWHKWSLKKWLTFQYQKSFLSIPTLLLIHPHEYCPFYSCCGSNREVNLEGQEIIVKIQISYLGKPPIPKFFGYYSNRNQVKLEEEKNRAGRKLGGKDGLANKGLLAPKDSTLPDSLWEQQSPGAGNVAQMVGCLPSIYKALGLIPSPP